MSKKIFDDDTKLDKPAELISMEEQPQPPAPKKGKHKKVMSAERKAQLTEQLKKAREISRAKRGATAKEKKLKKLKEIESEIENNMVESIKKKVMKETGIGQEAPPSQPEQVNSPEVKEVGSPAEDLETRLEKKLRMKIENEYEHKLKDYKISSLQERLNDYKETKKMKVIQEEEEEKKPEPKVVIPDNISPLRNKSLMEKYRKIRSRHN